MGFRTQRVQRSARHRVTLFVGPLYHEMTAVDVRVRERFQRILGLFVRQKIKKRKAAMLPVKLARDPTALHLAKATTIRNQKSGIATQTC